MYTHVIAFSLFLVGCVLFGIPIVISYIWPNSETLGGLAFVGLLLNLLAGFASEMLLAKIFWDLGTKHKSPYVVGNSQKAMKSSQTVGTSRSIKRRSAYVSVYTESNDEDAELMARMWNAFRNDLDGSEDRLSVSTASIVAHNSTVRSHSTSQ